MPSFSRNSNLLLIGGLAGILGIGLWFGTGKPQPKHIPDTKRQTADSREVVESTVNRFAFWQSVSAKLLLDEEKRTAELPVRVEVALKRFDSFLEGREAGIRDFANSSIGWKEIWNQVKAQVSNAAQDERHIQIRDRFEACVFKGDDLQDVIEQIVKEFVESLDGEDARTLEEIRTEVRNAGVRIPDTVNQDQFRSAYQAALSKTVERMTHSVSESVDRVLFDAVVLHVATHVAIKLAKRLAKRAGVATAAGAVTFGIGVVAMIVVSLVLDAVLPNGADPVEAIADQIRSILQSTIHDLKNGNSEWRAKQSKLLDLAKYHSDKEVRQKAREVAALIEQQGLLGLRQELFRIAEQRTAIRRVTLSDLIQGETK